MPDLATMPDIEGLLTDNLTVGDPAVPVGTKTPNEQDGDVEPPAEFVRVQRVGGVQDTRITDTPSVVAEAWALDEEAAGTLMTELRLALQELAGSTLGGHKINAVTEIGGVVNLPDPLGKYERYTLTVSIHVRGAIT